MPIVLEEEDEAKLQFFTSVMSASKTSSNSIYAMG